MLFRGNSATNLKKKIKNYFRKILFPFLLLKLVPGTINFLLFRQVFSQLCSQEAEFSAIWQLWTTSITIYSQRICPDSW